MSATTPYRHVNKSPAPSLLLVTRPRVAEACALLALAYVPYCLWFGEVFPTDVFGFSLMASMLPLVLVLVATLDLAQMGRTSSLRLVTGFGLVAVTIVLFRLLDGLAQSLGSELSAVRWLVIIPGWTFVFRDLLAERAVRKWARRLLLTNTLVAAGMGIAYRLGLADIRLSSPSYAANGLVDPLAQLRTQASGLMLNPNLFSAFLLLGVAVLLLGSHLSLRWTLPALVLLVMGIAAAGSRWPIGGALFLMAFLPFRRPLRSRSKGNLQMGRVLIAIVGLWTLLFLGTSQLASVHRDAKVLLMKSSVGWQALTKGFATVLLGANSHDLARAPSALAFSDNGWLQMSLTAGVPITVLFVIALWGAMRRPPKSRERFAIAVVLIGTMTVNSANLWDLWIACAAATYWLISYTVPQDSHRIGSASQSGLPSADPGLRPGPVTSRSSHGVVGEQGVGPSGSSVNRVQFEVMDDVVAPVSGWPMGGSA